MSIKAKDNHAPCSADTLITALRLALSGAILGIAIMNIIPILSSHDLIGGVLGFFIVLIAKLTHFF